MNKISKFSRFASVFIKGRKIKVVESALSYYLDEISKFKPFTNWCKTIDKNIEIESIEFQSLDKFKDRIGFLKLKAQAINKKTNKRIPGVVFLRGANAGVLVVLENNNKKFILLTKQSRLPIGSSSFLEIPAGMLDDEDDANFVALKELKEETGIDITKGELINLTNLIYKSEKEIKVSPGGSDESIKLFLVEKKVTDEEISLLKQRVIDDDNSHEHITLEIMEIEKAYTSITDMKTLVAMYFYEKYK